MVRLGGFRREARPAMQVPIRTSSRKVVRPIRPALMFWQYTFKATKHVVLRCEHMLTRTCREDTTVLEQDGLKEDEFCVLNRGRCTCSVSGTLYVTRVCLGFWVSRFTPFRMRGVRRKALHNAKLHKSQQILSQGKHVGLLQWHLGQGILGSCKGLLGCC